MALGSFPPSIRNIQPIEFGGVIARQGFVFQDHVAVSFCLEMLNSSLVEEVWCETLDDITLIKGSFGGQELVEYVQVKDIELGQLWSIAKLCEHEKTTQNPDGVGFSILERSLAHDRCVEPCFFRIITSLQVNHDLEILGYPINSQFRQTQSSKIDKLITEIDQRLPNIKSENGNGVDYWVTHVFWEVQYSIESVMQKNLLTIVNWIFGRGITITPDLIESEIYSKLLEKVRSAAEADWKKDPNQKKIIHDDFTSWLTQLADTVITLHVTPAGSKLQEKMERAGIAIDYIHSAQEERRLYRQEILNPSYLDLSDHRLIEAEVLSNLDHLRAKMDNSEEPEGFPFYKTCLSKLKELVDMLPTRKKPLLSTLHGCMHDITDRCFHRYVREPR